jgi:hypothetical protein
MGTRRSLLAALFACLSCAERPGPAPPPPRLAFTEVARDVGVAAAGSTVAAEFAFTNAGGQTLVIERLRTGCGCSAAIEPDRPVPPAGHGRVVLRCPAGNAPGRQRWTVTVYGNDPAQPFTVLALAGEVR